MINYKTYYNIRFDKLYKQMENHVLKNKYDFFFKNLIKWINNKRLSDNAYLYNIYSLQSIIRKWELIQINLLLKAT
jgi:hypothetical protein